jgi:hypothetical protein
MSEFYNRSSAGGGCSYASLAQYNQGYGAAAMAPVPATTPSMATTIVPTFGAPGYDTLQHGANVPGCGGYFNIKMAYPQYDNNCTAFTSRMCN